MVLLQAKQDGAPRVNFSQKGLTKGGDVLRFHIGIDRAATEERRRKIEDLAEELFE